MKTSLRLDEIVSLTKTHKCSSCISENTVTLPCLASVSRKANTTMPCKQNGVGGWFLCLFVYLFFLLKEPQVMFLFALALKTRLCVICGALSSQMQSSPYGY